jgi:squalene-hopene/tetraprenyl-beta-curcumene cyclase
VFQQIGIRAGETYTWRHFSTAWAIKALLTVDKNLVYEEVVTSAVMYLIRLRDVATSGWRSSEDADPFTWATCNALDTLDDIANCLSIRTPDMFSVISQWHQTRHLRGLTVVNWLGSKLVYNSAASLTASLLITVLVITNIALLAGTPKPRQLAAAGALCALVGVPWVFHAKARQFTKWSEAIIFVYAIVGVLTAILLAVGTVTDI